MTVITELDYTDKCALIRQIGYFGKHTCQIEIPLNKIELIANTLSEMYFKWFSQINGLTENKHLYYQFELDKTHKIEIEEGLGNTRQQSSDQFAIYEISDNRFATVVFPIQGSLILSGLLKNKEKFTWENEQK